MASLLFVCPKTNQQAPTGIETDVQSLSASWKAALKEIVLIAANCTKSQCVRRISMVR
jgi:hypothetical protein